MPLGPPPSRARTSLLEIRDLNWVGASFDAEDHGFVRLITGIEELQEV